MRTIFSYIILLLCTGLVHVEVLEIQSNGASTMCLLKNLSWSAHEHFTSILSSKTIKLEDYPNLLVDLDSTRIKLNAEKRLGSSGEILSYLIADSLAPYWVGTPWNFNGISRQPQTGSIACGYFVFGLLEDAGFNIARVKLSQAASETAIKAIVEEEHIKRYRQKSIEDFVEAMKEWGDGIYLVGLDYHIAMIQVKGDKCHMIHSSVYHPGTVVIEDAAESLALIYTDYRVVGKLNNQQTFQGWLEGRYFGL